MHTDDAAPRCRLLLISGSLRSGSTNVAVLKTAQTLVPAGVTATLYRGMGDLPHFNPDDEQAAVSGTAPGLRGGAALAAAPAALRAMLAAADAVLFCTPEYAGSLPGSFKNLLDWTVGDGLYAKPVGWINASPQGGADGAHQTLRVVLGYVSADIVEGACVKIPVRRDAVGANGIITDAAITSAIGAVLGALVNRVESRASAQVSC